MAGYLARREANRLEDCWEEFQRGYEVLFESVYGPLRAAVSRAVERFLKCDILHYGFR